MSRAAGPSRASIARICGPPLPSSRVFSCEIGVGDGPREVEELLPHGRVVDALIEAQQLHRIAADHRRVIARSRRLAQSGMIAAVGKILEEEPDGHIEDAAQFVEPAGADAVGAALVFLHLLKGEADRLAELLLAHA